MAVYTIDVLIKKGINQVFGMHMTLHDFETWYTSNPRYHPNGMNIWSVFNEDTGKVFNATGMCDGGRNEQY